MARNIKSYTVNIDSIDVDDSWQTSLRDWLAEKAKEYNLQFMLAFADDGVNWGRITSTGSLRISYDIDPEISPPLRPETLWEARLFSRDAELLLWKSHLRWQARLVEDSRGENREAFDEDQILWGTEPEKTQGFTIARETTQGVHHIVPILADLTKNRELRLTVRHYIDYDNDGVARIDLSRLVDIHT